MVAREGDEGGRRGRDLKEGGTLGDGVWDGGGVGEEDLKSRTVTRCGQEVRALSTSGSRFGAV